MRDYCTKMKHGLKHKCTGKCRQGDKECKSNFGKKGQPIIKKTEFNDGSMFIERNHPFLVQHTLIMVQGMRRNTNTQWLGCGEEVATAIAYVCDCICKAAMNTGEILPIIFQIVAHKAE